MKTSLKALLFFLGFQFLVGFGQAEGQVDPTKALIGTWEGTVSLPRDNERVIVISSVKPKEDGSGWVAEGRFGQTREKLSRMTYDVSQQGNDIIVEFVVTSTKNPGRLKLVGDKKLDGEMDYISGGGKRIKRSLTLEKVESK